MSLLVRLSEQMQVRAAVSRTVTTPTFREVAPFAFFDVAEQALVQGNPLLKPADALSGELRWELYPDVGEMLSLGVFAKSIRNALEETIFPQQSELTRTYANSEQPARILGAEAEFRYRFGLPGSSVKQFALQGNFTLLHGRVAVRSGGLVVERQLWGQSPYALNLGLTAATPGAASWGCSGIGWDGGSSALRSRSSTSSRIRTSTSCRRICSTSPSGSPCGRGWSWGSKQAIC
jgi:outer membrane receptor protein involved in Fe transport